MGVAVDGKALIARTLEWVNELARHLAPGLVPAIRVRAMAALRRPIHRLATVRPMVRVSTSPRRAGSTIGAPMVPAQATTELQWNRVTGLVGAATEKASAVASAQRLATEKLDAAEYALGQLLDDLSAVMVIPTRDREARLIALPSAHRSATAVGTERMAA